MVSMQAGMRKYYAGPTSYDLFLNRLFAHVISKPRCTNIGILIVVSEFVRD